MHHLDDADPGNDPETDRAAGRAPDLTLRDVVGALERLWPVSSAAEWDRVGLVTGELDQPVRRILFALDPTLAVIEEARDWGADLLVTHHPLLL
ncbi:MAG TPA: Nif3-like dinuclear metal center hexameric protein, partial [Humibacillus xanthopallidus]|nr:Nif3-like dinuclear metal center hexameric protein [Humibacillus xanthopallidus]